MIPENYSSVPKQNTFKQKSTTSSSQINESRKVTIPQKKSRRVKNSRNEFGLVKRSLSFRQVEVIVIRQHAKCNLCKMDLNEGLEFDHVVEIIDGGTNDDDNYQALCGTCHNIKTKLTEDERKRKKQELLKKEYAAVHRISPYFNISHIDEFKKVLGPQNKTQKVKNVQNEFGIVKRAISIRQVKLILTRQHAKCNSCKIDLNKEGVKYDNYQALCEICYNNKIKLIQDEKKKQKELESLKREYAGVHQISPYFL